MSGHHLELLQERGLKFPTLEPAGENLVVESDMCELLPKDAKEEHEQLDMALKSSLLAPGQ